MQIIEYNFYLWYTYKLLFISINTESVIFWFSTLCFPKLDF